MRKPSVSAQYSTMTAGSLGDRVATRMRRVMFERFLSAGVEVGDTILDVGATSDDKLVASNYLEAWYPYKDRITACGVDDASFLEQKYPGVRYVQGNGCHLPFRNSEYDVVHSSAVLEHVGSHLQQKVFISELVRTARKFVFLTTPNRWFPIEFHTLLPLLHWLPPRTFRRILTGLGHDQLSLEENLNLLGANDIFCGVNAVDYSGYPDCRPPFIDAFQKLANLATRVGVESGAMKVHAPLMMLSKADIAREGMRLGVDFAQTVSCYQADSDGRACGHCDACDLRAEGFRQAGIPDPTRYQ